MVVANELLAYWVDAFTTQPFQGNPAVVIPQADDLTDVQMQQIAREVNCSETAFVLTANSPEADFRLRWFTPTQEVDLCGHATIATLHVLGQEGRFNLSRGVTQILYLETRSGVLSVTVDWTEEHPWIWLTLPKCSFDPLDSATVHSLSAVLGLSQTAPSALCDSLNQDVLLEVQHLALLQSLTPDMAALEQLGKQQGWRGVCVYTIETIEPASHAHLRFFAPQFGIPEDPVTGSVSGPLALLLQDAASQSSSEPQDSLLDRGQTWQFEQGDSLGRSGRLWIELKGDIPKLGGQAITVMRGELYL